MSCARSDKIAFNLTVLVILGAAAFAAVNLDDIFLLTIFFSASKLSARRVITGQYLGFGLLVAVSLGGALLRLAVPSDIIGLLGIIPILIGVKKLFEFRKISKDYLKPVQELTDKETPPSTQSTSGIATITFTDGSDDIGVFVPLFASHAMTLEITTLVAVFMGMTALWCAIGYEVAYHSLPAKYIRRFGRIIFPFVLIAIGVSVIVEGFFPI